MSTKARKKSPSVTLTAYTMGPNATEEDFDSFAHYVGANIDKRFGRTVDVEQFRFGTGPDHDAIDYADEDEADRIKRILWALWDEWCARGGARG